MRTIDNDLEDVFLAGWSLLLGAGLVIAPWYLGFANQASTATWSAWASGASVIVLAILALMQAYDWLEYLVAIAGLWLITAPWTLGLTDLAAVWTHLGFGIALIISAAAELWRLYQAPGARSL